MPISKRVDYAVRVMVDVATFSNGAPVTTKEIAARQLIPAPLLVKIITHLAKGGFLRTQRGSRGGVALGRPAEEVSLLEVIEAVDGPIMLNRCVRYPEECRLSETCPVHDVWVKAQKGLTDLLSSVTFSELVAQRNEKIMRGAPTNGHLRSR